MPVVFFLVWLLNVRVVEEKKPFHIVVLGAGFGGLTFLQEFSSPQRPYHVG